MKCGFPVGDLYLTEVLSHNRGMVASFYPAVFEIFDIFLKSDLKGINSKRPERFSFDEAFLHAWWVTRVKVRVLKVSVGF